MGKFNFETELFQGEMKESVAVMMSKEMVLTIDELSKALKHKDRSKTIRWCMEQVLREAIEQKVISLPTSEAS